MKNNFAYFIASYGKPNNLLTYNCLQKLNANYPIYIVIGDDDPQIAAYKQLYADKLLVFSKADYIERVDNIGSYANTHKICTYSRLAVNDFADQLNYRFVGFLFDDINSMALRYLNNNKISSIAKFNIDDIIDLYINLLTSSPHIYIVGPPQSSFYIGCKPGIEDKWTARYGNMLIYDRLKILEPFKANTVEDMTIVTTNNFVGKMSICPFGLQVNCRDPHTTDDCYGDMTKSEYYQQWSIVFTSTIKVDNPQIPYKKFTPKIVSVSCRKENKKECDYFRLGKKSLIQNIHQK